MMSLKKKYSRKSPAGDTRQRILDAATQLFAEKGYDGTSTKEICQLADVNIAAIHYHFSAKEKLLSHILESYGDQNLQSAKRILEAPQTYEDFRLRLQIFVENHLESMLSKPEVCRIVQTEIELLHERSAPVFKNTFLKRFDILVQFLGQAKKKKFIASNIDTKIAARLLFSQICHQTRTDAISRKYYGDSLSDPAYRAKWVKQIISIFTEGINEKSK